MRNPVIALLAGTAVAALALTGCSTGTDEPSADGSFTPVVDGKLTVCSNPPFEPFELTDDDGEVVGFDMSIMDEVATALELELSVVQTPFEGIQSGQDLNSGKCDVVASGITITEERKEKFDFSQSYFDVDLGLLVPQGSPLDSIEALADKKISVQQANTAEDWAKEKGLTTVQFEDVGLQVQALESGSVDAALNDLAVMAAFAAQNPSLEISATFPTGDQYGFGVKKGNSALLKSINDTLDSMHADGRYDTLYESWIGVAPSDGATDTATTN